MKNMI
ncbi:hypothetical protein FOXB_15757 [Fusarium oxysporum f. sp. conglutinans Fo5176]